MPTQQSGEPNAPERDHSPPPARPSWEIAAETRQPTLPSRPAPVNSPYRAPADACACMDAGGCSALRRPPLMPRLPKRWWSMIWPEIPCRRPPPRRLLCRRFLRRLMATRRRIRRLPLSAILPEMPRPASGRRSRAAMPKQASTITPASKAISRRRLNGCAGTGARFSSRSCGPKIMASPQRRRQWAAHWWFCA